jgi:uncharacterized cupin superfamily protein
MIQTAVAVERGRWGIGGAIYRIVASAEETQNAMFALEATEPPGGGPPLHIHTREDEFFLVLEGEVSFFVDGQVIRRGPGGTAFVSRGAAHCFRNTSDRMARLLVVFTPGDIEGFFEYGASDNGKPPSEELMMERLLALAPVFGLEVLGPSPL